MDVKVENVRSQALWTGCGLRIPRTLDSGRRPGGIPRRPREPRPASRSRCLPRMDPAHPRDPVRATAAPPRSTDRRPRVGRGGGRPGTEPRGSGHWRWSRQTGRPAPWIRCPANTATWSHCSTTAEWPSGLASTRALFLLRGRRGALRVGRGVAGRTHRNPWSQGRKPQHAVGTIVAASRHVARQRQSSGLDFPLARRHRAGTPVGHQFAALVGRWRRPRGGCEAAGT